MSRFFVNKDFEQELINKLADTNKLMERNTRALERIADVIESISVKTEYERPLIDYKESKQTTGIISMIVSPIIERCDILLYKIFDKLNKYKNSD